MNQFPEWGIVLIPKRRVNSILIKRITIMTIKNNTTHNRTFNFGKMREDIGLAGGSIFDALTDQVVIADVDGVIVYANAATAHKTGFSHKEIIGHTPGELWGHGMDPEFYKKMWHTIKIEKKAFVGTVQNTQKNGASYYAELRIYPVLDRDSNVQYFVGIEPDITDRMEEDEKEKDLISSVIHRIKSPLAAEELLLENILREKDLKDDQKNAIEQAREITLNLSEHIRDLLIISRLKRGSVSNAIQDKRIRVIVATIVKEVEQFSLKKGIKITIKGDGNIEISSAFLSYLVMQNIIQNAVYYAREGSKIVISLGKKKNFTLFSCRNEGVGIPTPEQGMIFSAFFRASNARKMREGTGLGLFMAKNISDSLGYKIWFESEEGESTTFYLKMPLS